jgi:thiol-disulfide isomerase/thioredoxin
MNQAIRNVLAIGLLAIIVLGVTGCGGGDVANSNSANSVKTNVNTASSKSKDYPPLASGLAEADLEMLDGAKFKVSGRKGKVLLLNIWGTWCGPCREEIPHLVEMQERYGSRGFEVIGLNIGDGSGQPESNEQITSFAERMKVNYTIARSPNSATIEFYKISKQQVVPQTLLVDREGHLRGVFIGGGQRVIDSMKNTVEKTMNEN